MNLNYAIFRSEPIYTLNDLAQIGSHNKREKKAYKSNPDIKLELKDDNMELVPLAEKYVKGFYNLTKEYKLEHDKRMENEREDRKKTFKQMLDKSKSVVADELLFTASPLFFKNMSKENIILWANTCMDFVYEDLGYTKEQVLHAIIHMDEKTPHIHCVVVPLVKKFDKRTNTERYTISKKQYIKDKIHLSELQDKYHERLTYKGFDLERGIKNSDTKNIKIKEFKKITRKLNNELSIKSEKLNNAMQNLEEKVATNKELLFDKDYVKIKKDTFDSINKVINETKKVMEVQPKIENAYLELQEYARSYQSIEKENKNIQKELKFLKTRNHNLLEENKHLKLYLNTILTTIKNFFRKILLFGNDKSKEIATEEIKDYYDNKNFNANDVYNISKGTTKEEELFDYVELPNYMKSRKNSEKDKDNYEMSL